MEKEPTLYNVLEKSFINNRLYEPGEQVAYDGHPGKNLEHVSGPKFKAVKPAATEADDVA